MDHKLPKGKGCRYWPWRFLKARTFGAQATVCPDSGGNLRLRALVRDPQTILRILTHLGLPTEVPNCWPAAAAFCCCSYTLGAGLPSPCTADIARGWALAARASGLAFALACLCSAVPSR